MDDNDKLMVKCLSVGAVLAFPVMAMVGTSKDSAVIAYVIWWAIISGGAYLLLRKDKK